MKRTSTLRNKWTTISIAFGVLALLSTLTAGFYYYQYQDLRSRITGKLEYVNIGIDYGNSTRLWYNQTEALSGATLFDVTKRISNINYTVDTWGTYITEINGKSAQGNQGWTYWIWHASNSTWGYVPSGADQYVIVGNEIFMWLYGDGFSPPS